jgi:hypothetical protein
MLHVVGFVASMFSVPALYAAARLGYFGNSKITVDLQKGQYTNISTIESDSLFSSVNVYVHDIGRDCRCPEESNERRVSSVASIRPIEIQENRVGWGRTTITKI